MNQFGREKISSLQIFICFFYHLTFSYFPNWSPPRFLNAFCFAMFAYCEASGLLKTDSNPGRFKLKMKFNSVQANFMNFVQTHKGLPITEFTAPTWVLVARLPMTLFALPRDEPTIEFTALPSENLEPTIELTAALPNVFSAVLPMTLFEVCGCC